MANINLAFDTDVSTVQQVSFTVAAAIWETLLQENVQINLHVSALDQLGTDGLAAGSATPLLHKTHYGVYQEYLAQDVTSTADQQVVDSLQAGNTFGVAIDGTLIEGNSDILLTRAQAKALGMEQALVLDNGTTWDRDVLENPNGLDGYIQFNNSLNWHYYDPNGPAAPEGSLDFLTMALHEIGHSLGFVSGLDGLINTVTQHSGELLTEGVTALDLLRHGNGDGIADLTTGSDVGFSLDGGATRLADLESGSQYQASHWRGQANPLGVMDPTLGYQERIDISQLDLTALDVLGWDIDPQALANGIDIAAIYNTTLQRLTDAASGGDGGTNDAGGWFQETGNGSSEGGTTVEGDLILTGSDGDDIIGGSPLGKDLITGHYGNDLVDGKGGDDILLGNDGDDQVYGGAGADQLYGGIGNDQLRGEDDNDILYGEGGHDVLSGGRGQDYLEGGAGRDVLEGDSGDDVLYGDANPNGGVASTQADFWVRIEAEEMRLRNFLRSQDTNASGGSIVEAQGWGQANTIFTGPSGTYDLVVGYDSAVATGFDLVVRSKQGQQVTTKATHSGQLNSTNKSQTITGVTLESGDWLEFRAQGDLKLDYLDVRTPGSTLNELHNFVGDQVEHRRIQWADMTPIAQVNQTAATYTYSGKAGTYNLYANYFDGSTATGQANILLNGQRLYQLNFDRNDDANHEHTVGLYIDLKPGDVITVEGQGGSDAVPLVNALTLEDVVSPGADDPTAYLADTYKLGGNSTYIFTADQAFASPGVLNLDLSGAYTLPSPHNVEVDPTTGNSYRATALFGGVSGYYDVALKYYDYEPDNFKGQFNGVGAAKFVFSIDNQEIGRWYADGTDRGPYSRDYSPSALSGHQASASRTYQGLQLNQFDLIDIQVDADGTDLGGFRYLTFTPVAPPSAPTATPIDLGSPDSDILRGGGGNDTAYGGGGDDALYGDAGNDTLYGEADNDSLWGGDGNDMAYGGSGNDQIQAGDGADVADGGLGNDTLWGGDGADVAYGGLGDDTLRGDRGNDILYGDEDLNATLSLSTLENRDTLYGGDGDDTLYGGQGADTLYGDAGNDTLYGDTGPNDNRAITLWEGQFKDGHFWDYGYGLSLNGWTFTSTLGISSEDWHLDDYFRATDSQRHKFGHEFAYWTARNVSHNYNREMHFHTSLSFATEVGVEYTLSFDEAYARSLQVLWGGYFWRTFDVNGPDGGQALGGEMLLQLRDDSFEKIYSYDHIPDFDSLDWQRHNLAFTGTGGSQNLSFLVDPITYLDNLKIVSQDLNALGHIHHDVLVGGGGNDALWGESGNDQLNGTDATARGALEQDTLTGGSGADRFILGDDQGAYYSTGGVQDFAIITDFTVGEDRLQLSGTAVNYQQSMQNGDLLLSYNNDLVAQLNGVTALDFTNDVTFV